LNLAIATEVEVVHSLQLYGFSLKFHSKCSFQSAIPIHLKGYYHEYSTDITQKT